jgi:hypothetical protein
MDISPRNINSSGTDTPEPWFRVEGREPNDSVGLALEEAQIGTMPGHCYRLYFPRSGEVAYYASSKTKRDGRRA